jgi:non-heme chloroperoxidase
VPTRSRIPGLIRRGDPVVPVAHGRADSVVLPAMVAHMLATIPTAEASWYEGVGHAPHLEEPERFNRELAALARRVHA